MGFVREICKQFGCVGALTGRVMSWGSGRPATPRSLDHIAHSMRNSHTRASSTMKNTVGTMTWPPHIGSGRGYFTQFSCWSNDPQAGGTRPILHVRGVNNEKS
jgi:hypothetical protein